MSDVAILQKLMGRGNFVTVHRVTLRIFSRLRYPHETAIFFEELLSMQRAFKAEWVYRTREEWEREFSFDEWTMRCMLADLKAASLVTTKRKMIPVKGDDSKTEIITATHFRPEVERFAELILKDGDPDFPFPTAIPVRKAKADPSEHDSTARTEHDSTKQPEHDSTVLSVLEEPGEEPSNNLPPSGSFEEEEKPKAPGKEDGQSVTSALSLPGIPEFDPHARLNARPVLQGQRQDVNDFTGADLDAETEPDSSTNTPEIAPPYPVSTLIAAEPSRPQPEPARGIPATPAAQPSVGTVKPNQSVIEQMAAKRTSKLKDTRKRYAIGANIEDATLREIHALVPGHYGFMLQLVHDTAMPKDKLLKWLKEKPHLVKAVGGLNQERYAEILKGARHQAGQHSTGWQQYAYVWFFELLSKANLSAPRSSSGSTTGTVQSGTGSSTKVPGLRDPLPEYMTRRNDTIAKLEYQDRLSSVKSLDDLKELIGGYFDRGEISFMTGRTFERELEQRLKYNWDWKGGQE